MISFIKVKNVKKPVLCTFIIIILLAILTGCSITHRVNTNSSKALKKDLIKISEAVKSVDITFTRPAVTCGITMTREPSAEELNSILARVKSFASVENLDETARKVGWKDHVWTVYLTINTDDNRESVEHTYTAGYLKSSDQDDRSEDNIDAYRTWRKME